MEHTEFDLSNCEQEPIHLIGSIQPHGFLLALKEDDLTIQHSSANTQFLLGIPYQELIGQKLEKLIGSTSCRQITDAAAGGAPLRRICPLPINPSGRTSTPTLQATLHRCDELLILEAEPVAAQPMDSTNNLTHELTSAFPALFSASAISDLLSGTAREIQRITDFDRVLIYQFDDDWNGTVVAEHRRDFMPTYMNQRFPASDIPRQARELYEKNWIRLLVDVDATPSPVMPAVNHKTGRQLDMSFSILRSMSQFHIEYLKNMDVRASMSISVIKDGRLWALIACHHKQPKLVDYTTRALCEFLAQLLSMLVSSMEHAQHTEYSLSLKKVQGRLLRNLSLEKDLTDGLAGSSAEVLEATAARGFALFFQGQLTCAGLTPSPEDLHNLHVWLNNTPNSPVIFTHRLSTLCPFARSFAESASGLLAVPISRDSGDWLAWFRPEVIQEIQWAGNPEKPVLFDEGNMRIHPRKSFELWKERLLATAQPWKQAEIDSALELRNNILHFVLGQFIRRHQAEAEVHKQREQFHLQREDWLAALAHDLQTPAIGADRLLELLVGGALGPMPDDQRELLMMLKESNSKQLNRILTLLEVFRYQTETGRLKCQPTALEPVISKCIEELMPQARSRRIEVRTENKADSALVVADMEALHRLVVNLLDNAIKFSKDGAEVEIIWESAGANVLLHVRDNGPGIPEADQKYLFERFWQGGVPGKYHVSIGLGLYLSRQIATALGGDIACHSSPGKGTTFTVTLPSAGLDS